MGVGWAKRAKGQKNWKKYAILWSFTVVFAVDVVFDDNKQKDN